MYDLRACGDSAARWAGLGVRDVDDLVSILGQMPDERPTVLYGFSYGAGIALGTAAREPKRVVGVIVDGAFRFKVDPLRTIFKENRYPKWPILPLAMFMGRLFVPGLGFDRAADAAKLDVPVLLFHGDRDPRVPFASGKAVADAAKHATFVAIEGGAHGDLATVAPERYRDALDTFFAELSVKAAT